MPLVKDLMTKEIVTVDQYRTVSNAATLMTEKKIGCVVIMDGEVPVGIVTERDFVRRAIAEHRSSGVEISEIMSHPLITIDPDASIREAARVMIQHKIRRLLVVKEGKLVGIITVADFARQLSKKSVTEHILEAMARYPPGLDYQMG
jgi:CBS domain-containing protein